MILIIAFFILIFIFIFATAAGMVIILRERMSVEERLDKYCQAVQ